MSTNTSMIFEGPKKFSQILEQVQAAKNIHEVYFFLRGIMAGTHFVKMDKQFDWLFDGQEHDFDSEDQVQRLLSNLFGLSNLVVDTYENNAYLSDLKQEFIPTQESMTARLKQLVQKNTAYWQGLGLAETNPGKDLSEKGQAYLKNLLQCTVILEKLLAAAESSFESVMDWEELSKQVDESEGGIETCIQYIYRDLAEARKQGASSAARSVTQPVKSVKMGSDLLCPCGSGKKYKHCCVLKVN